MTKRADGKFARVERDWYPTPAKAVAPLTHYTRKKGWRFYEPCAGDGSLAEILVNSGWPCMGMSDVAPRAPHVAQRGALDLSLEELNGTEMFVTNPPWKPELMHPIIHHLSRLRPTWILLYADWLFTKQATPHLRYAKMILAVGRVRWMPDTDYDGYDNACWVLFNRQSSRRRPEFIGRRD